MASVICYVSGVIQSDRRCQVTETRMI